MLSVTKAATIVKRNEQNWSASENTQKEYIYLYDQPAADKEVVGGGDVFSIVLVVVSFLFCCCFAAALLLFC